MVLNRRFACLAALVAVPSLSACAPAETEWVAARQEAIIGGELDTTNQAVVAVFGDSSACTGTILYATGGSAYILTAAHCFGSGPLKVVARGNDYENPDQVLQVVSFLVHPDYSEADESNDFAMLKAKFAADNIPQILPMAPVEDKLKPGTVVEHVGYGLISYPDGQTTKRHHAFGPIDQLSLLQFSYNQPKSGPCSGDSGGPELIDTPNGKRVAGVVSYGDQECKSVGVSGRVSGVYKSFILPFIGGLPNDGMSGSSSSTSVSSSAATGGSASSAEAAVSSSAATGGVGGASATSGAGANDAWTAGDLKPTEHAGDIVTTSCAMATRSGVPTMVPWLLALGLALVTAVRRRPV
jgi:secreted trypsin-like serine protease